MKTRVASFVAINKTFVLTYAYVTLIKSTLRKIQNRGSAERVTKKECENKVFFGQNLSIHLVKVVVRGLLLRF